MTSELKPVMEGIFTVEPSPRLLGAKCPSCDKKFFPKPMVCPNCLGEVQNHELSPEGKIHTYAVLRTRPPYGLPQPYAVGWVDIEEDGLRIFSLLDPEKISEIDFGKKVTLQVGAVGVDNSGQSCLRYYFTPTAGGDPS